MRKRNAPASISTLPALFVLTVLALCAGTAGASERSIVFGADDEWQSVVRRETLVVRPGRQGFLDLSLEQFRHEATPTTELLLHFDALPLRDAARRYGIAPTADVAPELTRTSQRTGTGALLIDGPEDRLVVEPGDDAAFAPGVEWASFSIEFFFYPVVLSDGGSVLGWRAREGADEGFRTQELAIEIERGKLQARFDNFFLRPDGSGVSVTLQGPDRLIPRSWSHHLIRFDAESGLFEYLVDGIPADITYVSRTGREDGSVYFPRIADYPGNGLVIADGLVGALDELRIERRRVENIEIPRFAPSGGSLITDFIDLGSPGSTLSSVDAVARTPGLSDVFLYYRMADRRERDPGSVDGWTPVVPGESLSDARGRYLQIRAELLPDTRADLSPTLSQIEVTFEPDPPPPPPTALRATPRDAAVALEWAPVQDPDIEGYLVYYGDRSGRYYGTESVSGASPVDVGPATSVTIQGLENGTLYFLAVQAYDASGDAVPNELSPEVAARPAKVYR